MLTVAITCTTATAAAAAAAAAVGDAGGDAVIMRCKWSEASNSDNGISDNRPRPAH